MRSTFYALAPLAIAVPAQATTYLTVAQAQALMLPGAALKDSAARLTPEQVGAIKARSGVKPLSPDVHRWTAPDGSTLYVDRVVGKHEFITYALALDPGGGVRAIEILDYRESYGGEVRDARWRAQFTGKHADAPLKLDQDIANNSGGTLSARHVTDGVKRLLVTHAVLGGHS